MLSASDADDDFEEEEPLRPRRWGGPTGAVVPAFVAIHGAYHVLAQRLEMETRDHGFSASEAVVLVMARSHPMAAIAVVRHATGLRRSTMTSILDRLEDRGCIRRIRDPHDHRNSHLELTHSGMEAADAAAGILRDLDPELAVFVRPELLRGVGAVFEASRALGVPGTAADI